MAKRARIEPMSLEDQVRALESQNESFRRQISCYRSQAKAETSAREEMANEMSAMKAAHQTEVATLKRKKRKWKKAAREANARVQQLETTVNEVSDRNESLDTRNDQLRAIIIALESETPCSEVAELTLHTERQRAAIDSLKKELAEQSGAVPFKECDVCRVPFDAHCPEKVPRVLMCGHTVCTGCLRECTTGDIIRCPYDRVCIFCPDVNELPINFAIL